MHRLVWNFTLTGDGTEQTSGYYSFYLSSNPHHEVKADTAGSRWTESDTPEGEIQWTELDSPEGEIQIFLTKNGKYLSLTQKHRYDPNVKQKGIKKYKRNDIRLRTDDNGLVNRQKRVERDTRETVTYTLEKANKHLHEHITPNDEITNNTIKKNSPITTDITNNDNNFTNVMPKKSTATGSNEPKYRQKRFLPLFKTNNNLGSDNIIFRALGFLLNKGKNIIPVISVVREINTLVKSANGELNHVTKENNKYIGTSPSELKPITYTLELGTDKGVVAFIKRLLGMAQKGDKLTIGSR